MVNHNMGRGRPRKTVLTKKKNKSTTCRYCGKEFVLDNLNSKYCSTECSLAFRRAERKQHNKAEISKVLILNDDGIKKWISLREALNLGFKMEELDW